jgi:hypothetical protein
MNNEKIKLFLMDDDAVFLKSLEIEFIQHPSSFLVNIGSNGKVGGNNLK